jgi:hypothetical protein
MRLPVMKTDPTDRPFRIAVVAAVILVAACGPGGTGGASSPGVGAPSGSSISTAAMPSTVSTGSTASTRSITGEIQDHAIVLSSPIGDPIIELELHNVGTKTCNLVVALTSMPMDSLPVKNGQVLIDAAGVPGALEPEDGGQVGAPPDTYTLARVQPGGTFKREQALESAPTAGDRIILCNGVGDYQAGRYAVLRFQR